MNAGRASVFVSFLEFSRMCAHDDDAIPRKWQAFLGADMLLQACYAEEEALCGMLLASNRCAGAAVHEKFCVCTRPWPSGKHAAARMAAQCLRRAHLAKRCDALGWRLGHRAN